MRPRLRHLLPLAAAAVLGTTVLGPPLPSVVNLSISAELAEPPGPWVTAVGARTGAARQVWGRRDSGRLRKIEDFARAADAGCSGERQRVLVPKPAQGSVRRPPPVPPPSRCRYVMTFRKITASMH